MDDTPGQRVLPGVVLLPLMPLPPQPPREDDDNLILTNDLGWLPMCTTHAIAELEAQRNGGRVGTPAPTPPS